MTTETNAGVENLMTIENLHNLHFKKTEQFSPKWMKKNLYLRQISYDTVLPDTWFILDEETFDLFLYFEDHGTKDDPKILKLCKLSNGYNIAITIIWWYELAILRFLREGNSHERIENLKTKEDLKTLLKDYLPQENDSVITVGKLISES